MKGILRDSFILFAITLISGFLLGYVHDITAEPIAVQKAKAKQEACEAVFAGAGEFVENEGVSESLSYGKGEITEVLNALDNNGDRLGYVMTVTTHEGYGGDITFLIGIRNDGTVNGISITEISETAGLGMKAAQPEFYGQFANRRVEGFVYTKSGASMENEIDAISSATITTNAVTNAVNGALQVFRELAADENGGVQ